MPLHIYKRHLLRPVQKICPIPNLPLIGQNISIFSNKTFLVLILEKIHITESNFGKYLEPQKELTRFAGSKPLQKCRTGVTV